MTPEAADPVATDMDASADPQPELNGWIQRAALVGVAGLVAACATPSGRLLQRPDQ